MNNNDRIATLEAKLKIAIDALIKLSAANNMLAQRALAELSTVEEKSNA